MTSTTLPAPPGVTASPPTATAPPQPSTRAPRRPRVGWLLRWVSPLALLALWQLASSLGVLDERTIAAPATIARTGWSLAADGTLGEAALVSTQRVVLGFAIGAVIGLGLAVVAGLARAGEVAVDPVMQMVRTLPHFGLIPLFIIWFGIGEAPKLALIAMGVAFPLYLNTVAGIRGVDRRLVDAAVAMGLGWWARLRHVVAPGALPSLLVGLRQSLGIAWLSLIVAETVSAHSGLGYLINNARDFLQTDVIVVGLVVYSLLGLATDALVRLVERRALAWRA